MISLLMNFRPESMASVAQEWLRWLLLAVTLPCFAIVAGHIRGLPACMRESDIVARLGGDEFVALIENLGAPAGLDQLAQKIIDALAQPLQLEHGELVLSVSLGVAVRQRIRGQSPISFVRT